MSIATLLREDLRMLRMQDEDENEGGYTEDEDEEEMEGLTDDLTGDEGDEEAELGTFEEEESLPEVE